MSEALRILLVEDHLDTQELMRQLLTTYGHAVEVAGTMRDALDCADRAGFDLVISDLGLPDGSGLQLMRELRARAGLRGIALTGHVRQEDVQQALDAGFVAHLSKPLDFRRLRQLLAEFAGN